MSFYSKKFSIPGGSDVEIDVTSAVCTSTRHKTGHYNGIVVFVEFIEAESLTLTRDDLLQLKLVSLRCPRVYNFMFIYFLKIFVQDGELHKRQVNVHPVVHDK